MANTIRVIHDKRGTKQDILPHQLKVYRSKGWRTEDESPSQEANIRALLEAEKQKNRELQERLDVASDANETAAEAEKPEVMDDVHDLDNMTFKDLKAFAKNNEIKVSGNKEKVLNTIKEHLGTN